MECIEEWRPIEGFEDYAVSSLGRVKRVTGGRGARVGKILKPFTTEDGYFRVELGKQKHSVHRLVAQAFIPNPLNLPQVNHKKGKEKWNNTVSNLEWITDEANHEHASLTGLKSVGENQGLAKLTCPKVVEIRNLYAQGNMTMRALSQTYGVHKSVVQRVVRREAWKHVA